MKKLVELAEQYVEWVALGLGALFLLMMAWLYLLSSPVSTQVGTAKKTVTLRNVDNVIEEEVAQPLKALMEGNKRLGGVKVGPFAGQFRDALQMKAVPPLELFSNFWMGTGGRSAKAGPVKTTQQAVTTTVKAVPGPLPVAVWNSDAQGRSVVQADDAGAGSGAGAGGGVPGAAGGVDKMWVTEAFTVSSSAITAAFRDAGVPDNLTTAFVRIELIREEMLPDGNWGNRQVIPPLASRHVRPLPRTGDVGAEADYLDWAVANAKTLALPDFTTILAGDQWYAPGQPNPNVKKSETIKTVQPPKVTPPHPPAPRRYGMNAVPDGPARLVDLLAQVTPPGSATPAAPTGPIPSGFTVPAGNFVAGGMKEDFFVWAHDDTVRPDHTYHYKLRYYLKNPLFRSGNVPDPKMARQFAITSPDGEWGQQVYVSPNVYLFLAGGFMSNGGQAKFDMLRWQGGQWVHQSFTASPGDQVGSSDGSATSGWTLVDTRLDVVTREPKAVLSDIAGNLVTHSLRIDQSRILKVKKEIGYVEPPSAPKPGTP